MHTKHNIGGGRLFAHSGWWKKSWRKKLEALKLGSKVLVDGGMFWPKKKLKKLGRRFWRDSEAPKFGSQVTG